MSEYGCEALNWHTSDPKQGDYTEEYQAYYHEEMIKQLASPESISGQRMYGTCSISVQMRETRAVRTVRNHKGLVTFDRKYKKDSFYAYKAWLSDEPFVHLCGKRYVDRVEDTTKVTVYSNLPEVELFVNGKSAGKLQAEDHFFHFEVPNVGESTLVAVAGEYKVRATSARWIPSTREYSLKESGAILNWFDITEPEGYYSLNDRLSDIMKSEEGKALFMGLMSKVAAE